MRALSFATLIDYNNIRVAVTARRTPLSENYQILYFLNNYN